MGKAGNSGTGGTPVTTVPPGTPVDSISGKAAHEKGVWLNITPKSIDLTTSPCTDLQYDPSTPTTLYAFFGGPGGLWKSIDAGVTWYHIGDLPNPNSLGRILIDPKDPNHMFLTGSVTAGSLGFYVSTDGGDHWKIPDAFAAGVGKTWNNDVYSIAADPADFNHFVLTFHSGWPCCGDSAGVLESMDGGDSYVAHNPPPGMDHGQGLAILSDPANAQGNSSTWLVGAGYNPGVFRTPDAGQTWAKVSDVLQDHGGFDAHYSAQGFLYIGMYDGVYRSTDNGLTWTHPTTGVPAGWYYSVIGDGKQLYTSQAFVGMVYDQPFLVSPEGGADEGTTWTPYGTQVLGEGPWKMTFDASNRSMYNAGWGAGAWVMDVKP